MNGNDIWRVFAINVCGMLWPGNGLVNSMEEFWYNLRLPTPLIKYTLVESMLTFI